VSIFVFKGFFEKFWLVLKLFSRNRRNVTGVQSRSCERCATYMKVLSVTRRTQKAYACFLIAFRLCKVLNVALVSIFAVQIESFESFANWNTIESFANWNTGHNIHDGPMPVQGWLQRWRLLSLLQSPGIYRASAKESVHNREHPR
jgi:hypothetical protein